MTEELKPCSFCGSEDIEIFYHEPALIWEIHCKKCHLGYGWIDKEMLIEKWNHRPIEDALRTNLDEAIRLLESIAMDYNWLRDYPSNTAKTNSINFFLQRVKKNEYTASRTPNSI